MQTLPPEQGATGARTRATVHVDHENSEKSTTQVGVLQLQEQRASA